jgi:hypothetical protein
MACDVDEREPMRISFARAWSLNDYCIDTVCRVHVECIHMWAAAQTHRLVTSVQSSEGSCTVTVASSGTRALVHGV